MLTSVANLSKYKFCHTVTQEWIMDFREICYRGYAIGAILNSFFKFSALKSNVMNAHSREMG
jgi:hypothetical protein